MMKAFVPNSLPRLIYGSREPALFIFLGAFAKESLKSGRVNGHYFRFRPVSGTNLNAFVLEDSI
jgi:hypothetical protein